MLIEPAAARAAGAGWRLSPETSWRLSNAQKSGLTPGTYTLQFSTASNFLSPTPQTVTVTGGQVTTITFTYAPNTTLEAWRLANFGTTANTGNAADSADPDGDGRSNVDEYAAGTNPNNRADALRVLSTTRTGATCTLTAAGKASRTYELQRSASLTTGPWTTITTAGPLSANGPVTLTDPAAPANAAYYRIRVSMP